MGNIFLLEYLLFTRTMFEKIPPDILEMSISEVLMRLGHSGTIVSSQKLIGSWKWDVYKYPRKPIPYVRFFQGRKKVKEFALTEVARSAIGAFLATTGVPSQNIPQISGGIYNTVSCIVNILTSSSKTSQRLPKSVKYV